MDSNTKRKTARRSRRGGKKRAVNSLTTFVAPVYKNLVSQSTTVTLEANLLINFGATSSGVSTSFGIGVFNRFNQLASDYRYCEFESHQITVDWDNVANSQNLASFAYYPVNPIIEAVSIPVPVSTTPLDGLAGSVQLQPEASNKGKWVPTGYKQQFSCSSLATNNTIVGYMLAYCFIKTGAVTVSAGVNLKMNVRFYGTRYNNVINQNPPIVVTAQSTGLAGQTQSIPDVQDDLDASLDAEIIPKPTPCKACLH